MSPAATTQASRAREIQKLVDEHAILGMQNVEIRKHLYSSHSVGRTELIPPPTKSAQKSRKKFLRTGVVDQGKLRMSEVLTAPGGHRPEVEPGDDEAPSDFPSVERSQEVLNQMAKDLGLDSAATVEIFEAQDDGHWANSIPSYFSGGYSSIGMTLLDRLIHGFAKLYREVDDSPESNFSLFRNMILDRVKQGHFDPGMSHQQMQNEGHAIQAMDAAIYPWFAPGQETFNLQASLEMAEIFLAGKPPKSTTWIDDFLRKPIYIDLHDSTKTMAGHRYISGIFCRPTFKRDNFIYTAFIEWGGQGYEALITGEFGHHDEAIAFPLEGGDDDQWLTEEIVDALYGSMPKQIEQIIAMAYMYCKSKIDAKQPIAEIQRLEGNACAPRNPKKARNAEKTHSYFRVKRLDLPSDRFGFKGKVGNTWSLDHIISVVGHFRWQPYGSRSALRKLIWIDAHEKGHGERHQPEHAPSIHKLG